MSLKEGARVMRKNILTGLPKKDRDAVRVLAQGWLEHRLTCGLTFFFSHTDHDLWRLLKKVSPFLLLVGYC